MIKRALPILASSVAVACALVLFLLWRNDRRAAIPMLPETQEPAAPAQAPTAAEPADPALDPAARKLVSDLLRSLGRRNVRDGETVLTFKDDAALARFLQRARKAGLAVTGQLDALRAVRVRYDNLRALRDELAQNAADYADAAGNYLFNVPQIPAKEYRDAVNQIPFGNDTLAFIGANGDRTSWGRGVTIAVLDTGVAADITFGTGRVSALDIGYGFAPGRGAEDGHGTSVASLVAGAAADAPGVAPGANILSIRVTDANGTSDIFTLSQGIIAAVDAGAKIVNVSLGGYATNVTLDAAISYAVDHGAVIVAAAGNDQAAQLEWPAADPRVVSVGAVDKAGQQVTFSNSGSQLQLTAPGYHVQTAWLDGQRAYVDGTSASAPIVSGSLAALMSQNPAMTAAEAVQILNQTASDAGAPGDDPAYGNGIVNLGWALNVNNPNYTDTAVASHYYDAANNQMDFVVQNRSGHTVSGMTLTVTDGVTSTNYSILLLTAGQTEVVKIPVDTVRLNLGGSISYTTTLTNATGVVDQIPANNRRSSVLTAPSGNK